MKTAFLALTLAALALADEPKPEPAPKPEAPLSEHQRDILRATSAELAAIESQYREQRQSRLSEQNGIVSEACAGIGVPEEAIVQGQCKVDADWVDPKTKKKTGRVFWEKPAPPVPAEEKK